MSFLVCSFCKPKWRRLVDDVFVRKEDPNASHKLVNYCLQKTDKLHRVSELLLDYLDLNLRRKKIKYVERAMHVVDRLVAECHHQQLNQIVIPFLTMVQHLLEENAEDFLLRGTLSFVEFCRIEEATANYHREYDTLLGHFTRMSMLRRNPRIQKAGIQGIEGIILKTTHDQLQVDLYKMECMDKIIPSLLMNINISANIEEERKEISLLAISVFHEISRWASRHDVKPVVGAILRDLDQSGQWAPQNDFAKFVFQQLGEASRNSRSGHRVVKQLVEHLNHRRNTATWQERVGMVEVICHIVCGLAQNAVGPDLFHIYKILLEILRSSIEKVSEPEDAVPSEIDAGRVSRDSSLSTILASLSLDAMGPEEKLVFGERKFQDAIIATLGEFAKNLPNEQKLVIMKFILNFDAVIDIHGHGPRRCLSLVKRLLETMLAISAHYETHSLVLTFSSDFLQLLLLSGEESSHGLETRLLVQTILHMLIDRHENKEKLQQLQLWDTEDGKYELPLTWEDPMREDVLFIKKTGQRLLAHLYRQLVDPQNSGRRMLRSLGTTLSLLIVELAPDPSGESAVELVKLLLLLQNVMIEDEETATPLENSANIPFADEAAIQAELEAVNFSTREAEKRVEEKALSVKHRCRVLAITASHFSLLGQLLPHPQAWRLRTYIQETIQARQECSPYLLPQFVLHSNSQHSNYPDELDVDDRELFQQEIIVDILREMGCDTSRIHIPFSDMSASTEHLSSTNAISLGSAPNPHHMTATNPTTSENSGASTPSVDQRNSFALQEYSFDTMREVINEPNAVCWQRQMQEQGRVLQYFKRASFNEICEKQRRQVQKTRRTLYHMLDFLPLNATSTSTGHTTESRTAMLPLSTSPPSFSVLSVDPEGSGNMKTEQRRGSAASGITTDSTTSYSTSRRGSESTTLSIHFGQPPPTLWDITYPAMFV